MFNLQAETQTGVEPNGNSQQEKEVGWEFAFCPLIAFFAQLCSVEHLLTLLSLIFLFIYIYIYTLYIHTHTLIQSLLDIVAFSKRKSLIQWDAPSTSLTELASEIFNLQFNGLGTRVCY